MRLVKHTPAASRAAGEERLETLKKTTKPATVSGMLGLLIYEHFRLNSDGLEVEGTPNLADYARAGDFITHAEHGAQFWLADWLTYGDSRPEWASKLQQAQELHHYKPETIEQFKRVARKVPKERRRPELSYNHHKVVESCSPSEQRELLAKAVDEGWTTGELRKETHARQRRGILKGQAPLEGKYRVWYVDFPWIYNDSGEITDGGAYGRAHKHYPGMTIAEGFKLPVKAHATKDAVLFMWITAPMLYYSSDGVAPDPYRLIRAWGFEPKTGLVWDKVLHNFGHYVGIHHEHLLIATRGSCTPDHPVPQPDSVQTIRRSDVHSEKPEEFAKLIEKLYDGPYVELFARKPREGWTTWGNQILEKVLSA